MNDHLIPEDSADYEYCMEIYIKEKSTGKKKMIRWDNYPNQVVLEKAAHYAFDMMDVYDFDFEEAEKTMGKDTGLFFTAEEFLDKHPEITVQDIYKLGM